MRNSEVNERKRAFKRIPRHIGVIPDGNRRWAVNCGLEKKDGYQHGLDPGFQLYDLCREMGVEELTLYGFTVDNTKRPAEQKSAFQRACVDAVLELSKRDAELLVMGNDRSPCFPEELRAFTKRTKFGQGGIKVNFLVNYGWDWDLMNESGLASRDISRIDLIMRWGGMRRLSGFLPVQSVYADIYVLDEFWPEFTEEQFYRGIAWYQTQDKTLGG
ncbi:undecaprenyl diphosphate synthase family protein [Aminipila luticellarii]|uniref:Undecaprenyl diphosphate synthase family protein n=1 Tax=Aminipila luticellarii TaxID=2507160 RepID=A0A410PUD6_9FIRM|nr:undecaprenyl diphosphate synthase family protein [Aminipila luticellarii]QAT42562.1 undecaprenyl diphosphate synthase family protein [Aminipila luticellarii]